jgi:hypothetical protein
MAHRAGPPVAAASGQHAATRAVRRWLPVSVQSRVTPRASNDEVLARIQRAKQYKEPGAPPPPPPPPPGQAQQQEQQQPPAAAPPPPPQQQQPGGASWLGALGFSPDDAAAPPQEVQQPEGQPERRGWATSTKYIPVPELPELYSTAPKRSGTGSGAEPADWLKGVLASQPTLDAGMRMWVAAPVPAGRPPPPLCAPAAATGPMPAGGRLLASAGRARWRARHGSAAGALQRESGRPRSA